MFSTDEHINERKKEYAEMKKAKDPSISLESDFPENRKYKHMLYWPLSVCILNVHSWIRGKVRFIYKDVWTAGEIKKKKNPTLWRKHFTEAGWGLIMVLRC